MSITSHQTISIEDLPDGAKRVIYEYTFSEGPIVLHGPRFLDSTINETDDRTALVPNIEAMEKESELFLAEARAIDGEDFNVIKNDLIYNTTAEAAEFILKRMSNRFQVINKRNLKEELPELLLLRKIWVELTDAQIANFMGELEVDVATWRTSFETMEVAILTYSSPFGIYEDVP